jgi:hypothetical protein
VPENFDYDRAIYLVILLVVVVVLNRGAFARAREVWRRKDWRGTRDKGDKR